MESFCEEGLRWDFGCSGLMRWRYADWVEKGVVQACNAEVLVVQSRHTFS